MGSLGREGRRSWQCLHEKMILIVQSRPVHEKASSALGMDRSLVRFMELRQDLVSHPPGAYLDFL